jgi:hypothetical protein
VCPENQSPLLWVSKKFLYSFQDLFIAPPLQLQNQCPPKSRLHGYRNAYS